MPGASISAVARRYGLHPSQVFAWRKAARAGDIAGPLVDASVDAAVLDRVIAVLER